MNAGLMMDTSVVSKMEGKNTSTLAEAVHDIDQLMTIWLKIKPEAQSKLKLIIDDKISLLRECTVPKTSGDDKDGYTKYPLLGTFIVLAEKLSANGYRTDAVDDAVLEEVEAMIAKRGIGTPSTTEVSHCPHHGMKSNQ